LVFKDVGGTSVGSVVPAVLLHVGAGSGAVGITQPETVLEVTAPPQERVVLDGTTYRRDECGTWWILYGDESGPHSWSHTSGILAVALEKCRILTKERNWWKGECNTMEGYATRYNEALESIEFMADEIQEFSEVSSDRFDEWCVETDETLTKILETARLKLRSK